MQNDDSSPANDNVWAFGPPIVHAPRRRPDAPSARSANVILRENRTPDILLLANPESMPRFPLRQMMGLAATPRVMVIEDDVDIAEAIACMLEEEGLATIVAANGREALDRLRSEDARPDVILLDLMMPVMDGWEFRAEQRRDPSLEDIPVVLLSAHNDVASAAKQLAAKSWLRKPVEPRTLLRLVRQA